MSFLFENVYCVWHFLSAVEEEEEDFAYT